DGPASGATLCDLDADGDLDLLLSTDQDVAPTTLRLFANRGNGSFVDDTAASKIATHGSIRSVVCTDLDGDGLLDIYVATYAFSAAVIDSGLASLADSYLRNRGDGTFEDVASRFGFDATGFTWTVAASDYDGDGRLDLYVANDTFTQDHGDRPLPTPMPYTD